MKRKSHIKGFWDRFDDAVYRSGLSKYEIARRIGCNRKTLYRTENQNMNALYVAKFCAITKTDANWLLGLKENEA